jgi:RNA polymerase sigma factor (sigma-70 family)
MNSEDKKALTGRWYAQYQARLHAFLLRRVHRRSIADELVNEVYLRILRMDAASIRQPENYLFTVARHVAGDYLAREQPTERSLDIECPGIQEELSDASNLPARLDQQQRLERMRAALSELSRKCQDVVVLRNRYGLSYEETAIHLGISPHMVKKYLRQALTHCRSRLASLEQGGE